jgi:predicted nucleotidyltransferase
MNIGVIAEYNPFHYGHELHLEKTRNAFGNAGEDATVTVAMSGSFVQRGDFAVYTPRARAFAAVLGGADVVLELPGAVTLSSANYFAGGAVRFLERFANIDILSFGSESGSLDELAYLTDLLNNPELDELIRAELKSGVSYATARQLAAGRLAGRSLTQLKRPNNILAIEYLNALKGTNIKPLTIKRGGGLPNAAGQSFDTALQLRERLKNGENIDDALPLFASKIFAAERERGNEPIFETQFEAAILTRLRFMTQDEFNRLPDASEGLGNRLFKCVQTAKTLDELFFAVKTKRYAMSRIRRMVFCAWLGIRAGDALVIPDVPKLLAHCTRQKRQEAELSN